MPSQSTIDSNIPALPIALAERSRDLNAAVVKRDGEFVLYWMHHAVRGHENPALDVALVLANEYRLPMLVYQGLGGGHQFNNDRHHTFILQGARDAHRELRSGGIDAVFHLDTSVRVPSPLRDLSQRCALMVAEDLPAPPLNRWTKKIADQVTVRTIAVDCACVVPMQRQSAFSRAYAFRQASKAEYERRVGLDWNEVDAELPEFSGELGFDAVDLARMDIAGLRATCEIDRGIPPVAHTRGGSTAGYALATVSAPSSRRLC